MALSTRLAQAKALLDAATADAHPTTYNQPITDSVIAALQLIITEIDAVEHP